MRVIYVCVRYPDVDMYLQLADFVTRDSSNSKPDVAMCSTLQICFTQHTVLYYALALTLANNYRQLAAVTSFCRRPSVSHYVPVDSEPCKNTTSLDTQHLFSSRQSVSAFINQQRDVKHLKERALIFTKHRAMFTITFQNFEYNCSR